MSYELVPINKDVKKESFNLFTWNAILSKVGYVINCGEGIEPASYIAQGTKENGIPFLSEMG